MLISILIFLLVLLIFFSAFLSASETALFSLSHFTLKSYKSSEDSNKKIIARLLSNPRELLVTLMMLNVLANIMVQNVVSSLFDDLASWFLKVGIPLALTLVFGEVIPKSLALSNNDWISNKVAKPIAFIEIFLGPVRSWLTSLTNYISRFLFFFLKKEKKISAKELEHILKTSKARGILHSDETELASGYLELQEAYVKEVMRPREEILYFNINESVDSLINLMVEQECSRVPVCNKDLDNIEGIISVRRLFFYKDTIKSPDDLKKICKKPLFIPESTNAFFTLRKLREKGENLAIVVDEYGSISGLVTQEDLIESIVGEIVDLRDKKQRYTRSGTDVIIASGKMELSEFEDIFQVELTNPQNVVTIGGWLTEQLEDIPKTGTKYVTNDFLFYVLAADPNKVRRIYIRKIKPVKKKGNNG
ncbi:MAG: HlyC/CorC family transporter [Chlamydiae bacterium CG10_big_fil_rev_8_21_14_0_10_35_9]|nr:MAG: HlyC/CorC family transporter [Chlamydiae bacterium CG10_big_fil_rev_8_21_14_0_10_35_9]